MATFKQKVAFKEVLNGSTISGAMVKAGYAEKTTATTTGKLTNTKGWKELMDKHMPDSVLAKKHRELLNKREIVYSKVNGKEEAEQINEPDTQAVSKALDMAYKLKGRYQDDPSKPIINIAFLLNAITNGGTKEEPIE